MDAGESNYDLKLNRVVVFKLLMTLTVIEQYNTVHKRSNEYTETRTLFFISLFLVNRTLRLTERNLCKLL